MEREAIWQVELQIITWMSDVAELYDFNTKKEDENKLFKAVEFRLPVPKHQLSKHYYFIHQNKYKEEKYQILLERRTDKASKFDFHNKNYINFKLIGGFSLEKIARRSKTHVYIKPIQTQDILKLRPEQESQTKKPYLIVKTFTDGLALKIDQVLKLGKTILTVKQVALDYDSPQHMNEKDILNISMNTSYQSEEDGGSRSQKSCRICYEGDLNVQDPLICPCNCKGSTAFIHIQCLQKWLIEKLSKFHTQREGKMFHSKELFCEICKYSYPKVIRIGDQSYSLLPFIETKQAYLGFTIQYPQNSLQEEAFVTIPENEEVTIGRLESNSVIISDNSVSRNHGFIKMEKRGCQRQIRIYDRDSKFGTLLYEKDAQVRLHKNSMVGLEIGTSAFSFKLIKKQ